MHVNFRMHRVGDQWLIYDIVVEGVSLATTHRSTFSQKIRDIGVEGVIAELQSRNAEVWNENEKPAEPAPTGKPAANTD